MRIKETGLQFMSNRINEMLFRGGILKSNAPSTGALWRNSLLKRTDTGLKIKSCCARNQSCGTGFLGFVNILLTKC